MVDFVHTQMVELGKDGGQVFAIAMHVPPPRGPVDTRNRAHVRHACAHVVVEGPIGHLQVEAERAAMTVELDDVRHRRPDRQQLGTLRNVTADPQSRRTPSREPAGACEEGLGGAAFDSLPARHGHRDGDERGQERSCPGSGNRSVNSGERKLGRAPEREHPARQERDSRGGREEVLEALDRIELEEERGNRDPGKQQGFPPGDLATKQPQAEKRRTDHQQTHREGDDGGVEEPRLRQESVVGGDQLLRDRTIYAEPFPEI